MPTFQVSDSKRMIDSVRLQVILLEYSIGSKKSKFFVEHITGPVPRTSLQSAFTFGRTYQAIITGLETADIAYELVHSKKWKGTVLHNTDKSKQAAINWFNVKFPHEKTKHDGTADAACIAEYGRRLTLGVL